MRLRRRSDKLEKVISNHNSNFGQLTSAASPAILSLGTSVRTDVKAEESKTGIHRQVADWIRLRIVMSKQLLSGRTFKAEQPPRAEAHSLRERARVMKQGFPGTPDDSRGVLFSVEESVELATVIHAVEDFDNLLNFGSCD